LLDASYKPKPRPPPLPDSKFVSQETKGRRASIWIQMTIIMKITNSIAQQNICFIKNQRKKIMG
jgi:hypothetical protein